MIGAACKGASQSIVGALKKTWIDPDTGAFSLPHFASFQAIQVLSAAFIKNAWMGKADGWDYVMYATAMAASASPSLLYKLMALKFTGRAEETKA